MVLKYLLIAALVTIAGCSSMRKKDSAAKTSSPSAAAGQTAPQPTKPTQPNWMTADSSKPGAPVPKMDPSRKINEQSCATGGVDLTAGNLRCR